MPTRHALLAALLVLLAAWTAPAGAHTGGSTGFARISLHGQTVRYSLTLATDLPGGSGVGAALDGVTKGGGDYDALAGLVARKVTVSGDGRACAPVPGTVTPPAPDRRTAIIVVHYACAAAMRELTVRDDLFDTFGADYHTLANFAHPDGDQQFVFQPDRREAQMPVARSATGKAAPSSAFAFFELGVEHILLGFDHVLFVAALLLGGGGLGTLLGIVTAFTIAHSITLALSVLDVVTLPAGFVEPVIALSIAYVALENMLPGHRVSRRWTVAFLFGLVHGFGFAGILAELELRPEGLVTSLLSFNLGVETGQALIIALLLPPLVWIRGFAWRDRAVTAVSAIVLVVGLSLLVDRTLLPWM